MKVYLKIILFYAIVFCTVYLITTKLKVGPFSSPIILIPALLIYIVCPILLIISIVQLRRKKTKENRTKFLLHLGFFSLLFLYLFQCWFICSSVANMKISIITITYNSSKTLATTLESVANQDYPNIEHIIVDGLSKDNTMEIVKQYPHIKNYVSEKDKGLYDALNKGIKMATGDVIGLIHSDDFLATNDAISKVAKAFQENNTDSIIGDISFVNPNNLQKVVRHYSSKSWKPSKFAKGYMPAHPAFYCKKELFEKYGYYKMGYKIAADYELLIRFLYTHKVSYKYIPETLVYMRTGGTSNESFKSRILLNQEIVRGCAENGIKTSMFKLSLKYSNKVFEYVKPMLNNLFRKK